MRRVLAVQTRDLGGMKSNSSKSYGIGPILHHFIAVSDERRNPKNLNNSLRNVRVWEHSCMMVSTLLQTWVLMVENVKLRSVWVFSPWMTQTHWCITCGSKPVSSWVKIWGLRGSNTRRPEDTQRNKRCKWNQLDQTSNDTFGDSYRYGRNQNPYSDPWHTHGNRYLDLQVCIPMGLPTDQPALTRGLSGLVRCLTWFCS